MSKFHDAIKCYDKAIEIDSSYTDVWLGKGTDFSIIGNDTEGVNCFDKILEINPNHIGALVSKGITFSIFRNHAEAIKCYDKAIEINPNDVTALTGYSKLSTANQTQSSGDIILAIDNKVVPI